MASNAEPSVEDLLAMPFEAALDMRIRSAGKREEQIRDIPASVTILGRDEIQRYGWNTFEELLRSTPGFYLISNTEDRFIGTRGAAFGGVLVLVNGVPQHPSLQPTITATTIAQLDIPIDSIDRVEIIRGPMSVIYGNNAFFGIINVVTNRLQVQGRRVSASLGSNDNGRLFARAGQEIGQETGAGFWTLNLGADRNSGLDGPYSHMLGPDPSPPAATGAREDIDGDLDWQRMSFDFSGRWRGWEANLRLNRRDYGLYAFTPPFDDGTRVRLDTVHAALAYGHRFGDHLGLRLTGIYSREDYDAYRLDFLFQALEGDQQQSSERMELELDLHWRPRQDLDLTAGYRIQRIADVTNRINVFPLARFSDALDPVIQQDVFAELGWSPASQWRLIGGVRLSLLPERFELVRTEADGARVAIKGARLDDPNLLNGRLAVLWTPSPQQVVRLTWGTASLDSDQVNLADPQRIATTELGYTLTRPRGMLSVGIFENRISRLVRTIQRFDASAGTIISVDDNSGEWRTHGLELIAETRLIDPLSLSASLTWQQTDDRASSIDPGYSPRLLAKLKASWQQGPFTLGGYGNYVDGMDADWDFVNGPLPGITARLGDSMPGYWDLGLNLRWDPSGAGPFAALHVANLLNNEQRTPATELTELQRGLFGPGRTLTLTAGFDF